MAQQQLRIRQEGTKVLMIFDGKLVADMPWQAALEVGRAMIAKARAAETAEQEVTKQLIKDQALLLRSGAPLSLTTDPAIMQEAVKEALGDSELRRALPGRVIRIPVLGTPKVIQHKT